MQSDAHTNFHLATSELQNFKREAIIAAQQQQQ